MGILEVSSVTTISNLASILSFFLHEHDRRNIMGVLPNADQEVAADIGLEGRKAEFLLDVDA
eukprot:CAMPEP_0202453176 /NCGR_PEP_ID=MMETSP1360-20130828/11203_1 /ASSEMBLY_ACC=CAM_ASM_000848 /TAXON_ID=515479 /ORGANISM="Licmophora paradoxa, Strain CCMP2313" /LENGTH=61 /DNA_ID=CAMNT_0049072191 /DNA_START=647 /DNA_END=832 /DNA_ORIENTATION=-